MVSEIVRDAESLCSCILPRVAKEETANEPIRKSLAYDSRRGKGQQHYIPFTDLQVILSRLGFECRIKGDHFIYTKDGVDENINIQPKGNKAKPYQVRQVREVILKYNLGGSIL